MSVRDPKDPRPTLFKDKVLGPFFVHRVQWKIATKCNTSIEPVLEAPSTCYITLLRCFVKIWIQELHQQSWSKEFIALDALDSSASTPQKKIDAKVRPSGICWRTVSWASMIDCVARGRSLFDVNGPQRSSPFSGVCCRDEMLCPAECIKVGMTMTLWKTFCVTHFFHVRFSWQLQWILFWHRQLSPGRFPDIYIAL